MNAPAANPVGMQRSTSLVVLKVKDSTQVYPAWDTEKVRIQHTPLIRSQEGLDIPLGSINTLYLALTK